MWLRASMTNWRTTHRLLFGQSECMSPITIGRRGERDSYRPSDRSWGHPFHSSRQNLRKGMIILVRGNKSETFQHLVFDRPL
jgi:hypothetical protein